MNAVQYADWALGRFMRQARTHAFFDNTLFVLMGDHGPRVYGAARDPAAELRGAGPVLRARASCRQACGSTILPPSIDVPPTVLGLLGGDYESKFFGRDVLSPQPRPGSRVMTHNNEIALMRDRRLAVLGLRGATTVYDVDSSGAMRKLTTPDEHSLGLVEDAIAYFQTADELYRRGDYRFDQRPNVVAARTARVR